MTYQDKAGRYVRVSIEGPTLRGKKFRTIHIRNDISRQCCDE